MDAFAHRRLILVAEDDPDIRDGLVEVLRDDGYEVLAARDGREGLAAARAHRPALVILDLMMPVVDGFEFLEARAAEPSLAAIPVIVLTARRPVELSGCEVVYKPFDLPVLLAAVARRLGGTVEAPRPAAREEWFER